MNFWKEAKASRLMNTPAAYQIVKENMKWTPQP